MSKTVDGVQTKFYVNGNKILRSVDNNNDIWYNYGVGGIVGITVKQLSDNTTTEYVFRKNAQGDVTHIYKAIGPNTLELVAEYKYDAWGNHAVQVIDETCSELSQLNPFRYRGYYYDTETGLYFLKTRYYDPEVGRFITIDDLSYIDPETINGLNLYAYCGNNPVMAVDPNGNSWWEYLLGVVIILASVALSFATAGLAAPISAALGSGLVGAIVGGAVAGAVGGAIASFGISVATQGMSNGFGNIDWKKVGIQTAIGAASGALLGGVGGGIKYCRAASYLKANGITNVKDTLKNFKGIPSVKTSHGEIAYRYYDGVNALREGRYLTNALTNNPIKDLALYNNEATMVAKFMIEDGAKYLVGRIAGGSQNFLQYFVANVNWLTLLT